MQWIKLIAVMIAFVALPTLGNAQGNFQDTARDKHDQLVRDSWGGCVLTKWMVGSNECGGQAISVYFDFNKSSLNGEGKAELDKLIASLDGNKENVKANIVGYADRVGNNSYNLRLSEKRAKTVKRYLTKAGVNSEVIDIRAVGEEEPSTNCGDDLKKKDLVECLAQDRRVDIFLEYLNK